MAKFYVIEGIDGSGKTTQFELAVSALKEKGINVKALSFPRYGTVGSTFVEFYLGGGLGGRPEDTNAYAASAFYACDRYISYRTEWKDFCASEGILLACRYTTANAIHQLSKLPRGEWDAFLDWLWDLEFTKFELPAPDKVIYLDMPPELSVSLTAARSESSGQARDIHETDINYIKSCREAAMFTAARFGWSVIPAYEIGESGEYRPRSRGDVHRDVMMEIER